MIDLRFFIRRCHLLRAFTASLSISFLVTTVHAVLPIIALVPDAWHSPIHYLELTQHLSRAGYSVTTQRLPSCGSELPEVQSTAADAAFIRENVLLPQIDNGKAVVLVMHSYGGCPGAVAAKGLSMSERRTAGQKGGIIGMIFICGFIIRAATILRDLLPNRQFDPWIIQYVRIDLFRISFPYFYHMSKSSMYDRLAEKKSRETTNSASSTPPKSSTTTFPLQLLSSPSQTSSINPSPPSKPPPAIPPGAISSTMVAAHT